MRAKRERAPLTPNYVAVTSTTQDDSMTYEPLAAPRHDPMVAGHDIAVSDRGRQSSIAKADSRRSGALHVQHAGSRRSAHTVASSKASPSSSLRASSGLAMDRPDVGSHETIQVSLASLLASGWCPGASAVGQLTEARGIEGAPTSPAALR